MAIFTESIAFAGPVEHRQSTYTDVLVSQLVATAGGTSAADATATAALEQAAGLWSRAMAAARVTPETRALQALTPDVLAMAGRQVVRKGEVAFLIDVDLDGVVRLLPCASFDVLGGPDPETWLYIVYLSGPSGHLTRTVPAASVLHLMWARDPAQPWRWIGPLQYARSTGQLAGNLELRLGQEAAGPVGSVIPVPADGGTGEGDDPLAGLKADLRSSAGGVSLVETSSAGWGEGRGAAPMQDWKSRRFGADPPEGLTTLRTAVYEAICMACGLPVGLSARSDGTLARESWRQYILSAVEPLARKWTVEIEKKLNVRGVKFSFRSLNAHDIIGRASSFKRLVEGGMGIDAAASTSGVLASDEMT